MNEKNKSVSILFKIFYFLYLTMLLLVSVMRNAYATSCDYFKQFDKETAGWLYPYDLSECTCNAQAKEIRSYIPRGLKIVAACEVKNDKNNGNVDGRIFLKGEFIIEGTIKRNEWASGSNIAFIKLVSDWKYDKNLMFQEIAFYYIRFPNEESAFKIFRVPQLDLNHRCWQANSKIKVKDMAIIGGDGDATGAWVLDYEVLNLGKYALCEPE